MSNFSLHFCKRLVKSKICNYTKGGTEYIKILVHVKTVSSRFDTHAKQIMKKPTVHTVILVSVILFLPQSKEI